VSVTNPFAIRDDDDDDDDNEDPNVTPVSGPVLRTSTPAGGNKSRRHRRRWIPERPSTRGALNYEIANSRGKIARLCFFKNEYKLGDTVVAAFDFSGE
jgi:hypothetical protein